ncbi:ESPR-type extended signal peptide-containing protein [Utexia brackfieldae]|uniref:ESPR-type extended signal peptide-containing protein n=1 Tax=Utexia brackfieldae TaxID=3074108 RepID=UPI00370DDC03
MNKIYRVIWSHVNHTWIVVSELAKGRGKIKNSRQVSQVENIRAPKLSLLSAALFVAGFTAIPNAFAASCNVSTVAEFNTSIASSTCDTLVLTQDITLNKNLTTSFGSRNNITIDGNGHNLNVRGYRLDFTGGQNVPNGVNLNFINFNTISSNNSTNNPVAYVSDQTARINVTFNNITTMPNGTIAILSKSSSSGSNNQNPYSQLIIGNIQNTIDITTRADKQLANASKITFNGKLVVVAQPSNTNYSYVFFSNSPINQNVVTFNPTADVSIALGKGNKFTSGDTKSSKGYSYIFADNAKFLLLGEQNVFGDATGSNVGLKIGTYDKSTKTFGYGATLQVAGVSGVQLEGDGLTNAGGVVGGIDNGASGSEDVIFNLAAGSSFDVTGSGINVIKNAGNNTGIYVRSATKINADTGIKITHNGSGEVVVANQGTITSTNAGMLFSSTSGNNMSVDLTGGVLNVTSGDGIDVGTSLTTGNANLNIKNGTINLSGSSNAIDFSNSSARNTNNITGTTINMASGASGKVIRNNSAKVILKDTHINVVNSTAFTDTDLNNITFANSDDNKNNIITVKGAGIGLSLDKDLKSISDSYLTINVTDSSGTVGTTGTGTAIKINNGTTSDVINVVDNIMINAINATALNIGGTQARQLVNNGVINGNVVFSNGNVNNVITNNNQLNGNLTTGSGNDVLTLNSGSKTTGTINLGDGNNTVTIGDKTYVSSVTTGSGNDIFNLTNLNANSSNYIGTLDAGTGTNALNLTNSNLQANSTTLFKNFTNINLANSSLSLVNKNNLNSGTVNLNNNSQLNFTSSYNDSVGVVLAGAGTVGIKNGAKVTLASANGSFTGNWAIEQGAALNSSNANQLGSGTVNLSGNLNLTQSTFNNKLNGNGTLNVNTNGGAFNFGANVGQVFAGTINFGNSQFTLSGNNSLALAKAKLNSGTGNVTTVGSGTQNVGQVALNGGTLNYQSNSGVIKTNNLAVTAASNVNIDTNGMSSSGNLLDQNIQKSLQLIESTNSLTATDLAKLSLRDSSGAILSDNVQSDIIQSGAKVAAASYTYGVSGEKGLTVVSQLSQLDLQNQQTLTLDSTNATNRILTARVIGSGNLNLISDATGITLNNNTNSYSGNTTVSSGKIIAGSNSAFGQTAQLAVKANSTVDFNGKSQTVGSLLNDGAVNLNNGSLTLTNGGRSTVTNGLSGAGSLVVSGGNLNLSAQNNTLTANTQIGSNAQVTLANSGSLGSGAVNVSGILTINNANPALANIISGTGTINSNNAVTLTGNNSSFSGKQVIGSAGILTVNSANNLGSSAAAVNFTGANSTLVLNGVTGAINQSLVGNAGRVNITNNANTSLTGNNSNFSGIYNISGGSKFNINQATRLSNGASINVATANDTLNVNSNIDYTFGQALTGQGTINVDTTNKLFNFGSNVGKAFAGNVNLTNSQFTLTGNNTQALTQATLMAGKGNTTTVSAGTQNVGNVTLNGGQLVFQTGGLIKTDKLAVTDNSIIKIDQGNLSSGSSSLSSNLLDQSLGTQITLVEANNSEDVDIASLTLQDLDGNLLQDGIEQNLIQNNNTVAKAQYNYQLVNDQGLDVSYKLTQLDLQNAQTLVLSSSGATNRILSALVTGQGNLTLTTDDTGINLNNSRNNYTGNTNVTAGKVILGSNNAMGQTAVLSVNNAATVSVNGKNQTVGQLVNQGTVDLAGGSLTLTNGGSSSSTNGLTGSGNLTITGGDFAVSGVNSGLTAGTTIAKNGSVSLSGTGTLGTSAIDVTGALNLNSANSNFANTLSGAGQVNTNAAVSLTGNNSSFTGTQNIGSNGSLTVGSANNLGATSATVNLTGSGSNLVFNAVTDAITQALSGNAGTVTVGNGSNMSLTGNNSGFSGSYNVTGESTLTVSKSNNLGSSDVAITSGNVVLDNLNGGVSTELANKLTGTGSLTLSGTDLTLGAANTYASNFTGQFVVSDGSTLTLAKDTGLNSDATIAVDKTGDNLNIASEGAFTLNNALTGQGQLNVGTNGTAFNFGNNVGSAFAGNVVLNNSQFSLGGANTTALANGTLTLSTDSQTTVADGVQNIKNLTLDGGDLYFNHISENNGEFNSEGIIKTDTLDISGTGTVYVDLPDNVYPSILGNTVTELDKGNIILHLIEANNVVGNSDNPELKNADGNSMPVNVMQNLINTNSTVKSANGYFNYKLSTGDNTDGLYLSYGLVKIDLLASGSDALVLASTEAYNNKAAGQLSSEVTGVGDLAIEGETSNTIITMINSDNSYTGKTDVRTGILKLGDNSVLGNTAELIIHDQAKTDMGGNTQTVGLLTNSGTLDLAGGSLTLTNGGSSSSTNGLTGSGNLTITGGDFAVSGANSGLTAGTTIAKNGSVSLSGTGTLGTSAVDVAGALNLNSANSNFANTLSGAGQVNTNAAVSLTGNNSSFTGTQNIGSNGSLTVGSANNLGATSATVNLTGSGSNLVFNAVTDAIAQALSGNAGTVTVGNGSNMSLTGNNSGFSGSYSVTGESTLTVSESNNLGSSDVAITSGNVVLDNLNGGVSTELANKLTGTGSLTLSGTDLTLAAANTYASNFTGQFVVSNGSTLTLAKDTGLNSDATIAVDKTGDNLNIVSEGAFTLNNALTGQGQLNIGTNGTAFDFGNNVGSAFAGNVVLNNSQFSLGGANTTALANGTLTLSTGSKTTVAQGQQDIGNLTLNGGSLAFNGDGVVNTDKLSTTDNSVIQINQNNIPNTSAGTDVNLLDQNKGEVSHLVNATDSTALDVSKLVLQDASGNALTTASNLNIQQNDATVAKATYGYQLINDAGLAVTYTLQQLNLQADQTLTLDSTGATNREFTAQLTGVGNLSLKTDSTGISLNNSRNDYTGNTTITTGKVSLGSNSALGQTAILSLNDTANLNLNGNNQTVGQLVNQGTVDLAGGSLTLTNGGSSSSTNGLTGSGNLTITGGDFAVSGANSGLTAKTTIAKTGSVSLSGTGTLGTSAIDVTGALNLNSANSNFANTLSGAGQVNTNAAVSLTGNNSSFTGTQNIGSNGSLTVGSANNLGATSATVNLTGSGSNLVFNAVTDAIAQALSGNAGTVTVGNGSNMSLTGNNSGFSGSYSVTGESTLTVSKSNNLGSSDVAITSGNVVLDNLNGGVSTELANKLTGTGSLTLSGTDLTLAAANTYASNFTGQFVVSNGSTLTLAKDTGLNSDATIAVDKTGDNLNIVSEGAFTLNNALTGQGQLNIGTNGTAFDFGNNVGSAFAGNVVLNNSQFSLGGANTTALANGTLTLSTGSKTTVAQGQQDIGNLTLNGGSLVFNGDGVVNTDKLSTTDNSVIQINQNNIPNADVNIAANLFDQNKGEENRLINAKDSTELDVNKLNLQDMDGNSLSSSTTNNVVEDGITVAKASYDYQLVNNDGLTVAYTLKQLDLQADQTLTLDSTGATNREFTAQLTGGGNLSLKTDETGISLNNSRNDYTGNTTITTGKVSLGSNSALGQTAILSLNDTANLNLNGNNQTVGQLVNQGTVDLAGGSLTLTNGGSSSSTNGLTGSGNLTITGGDFAVSGANSGLTAKTTIAKTGSVSLSGTGTLGTSAVDVAGALNLNSANSNFANTLSGAGQVNTNAAVSLTGNNSSFTGTQNIGSNGSLTVGSANNLGATSATVNLTGSGSNLVFNAVTDAIAQALSGNAGTVTVGNGSNMSLTGNNSGFSGSYSVTGESTLTVSKSNNLGSSDVAITSGNVVLDNLNGGVSTELANKLTGTGSLTLSGTDLTLAAANTYASNFTGQFVVSNGSTLTLAKDTGLNSDATIAVDKTGDNLNIVSEGAFTLNNALTGQGQLNIGTNGTAFNFGNNVGSAFTGTVNLEHTTFNLDNNNTAALANGTLTLSTGSQTTVADGVQNIKNLTLNGGDLYFNHISENNGEFNAEGTIKTDTLDISGAGSVYIDLPDDVHPSILGNTVTELDRGNIILQLVEANNVIGSSSDAQLKNMTGGALPTNVPENLINTGSSVTSATGYFNYKLSTGDNIDGLYLSYGLVKIDLLASGSDALVLSSKEDYNGKAASDLTSEVTGAGDIAIVGETNNTVISISNSDNSYTGKTDVRTGILKLGNDNALGNTSGLMIGNQTKVDLNGKMQTIGSLTNSGTLDLAGGYLTVTDGGSSLVTNGLVGSGQLTIDGGELIIAGANANLTANTDINSHATVTLNDQGSLGTGDLLLDGILNLNGDNTNFINMLTGSGQFNVNANIGLGVDNTDFAGEFNIAQQGSLMTTSVNQLGTAEIHNEGNLLFDLNNQDQMLNNQITGTGNLIKNGAKTLTVNTDLNYTGNTNINQGDLFVNQGITLGGSDAGDLIIANNDSSLSGSGIINANQVINNGTINVKSNAVTRIATEDTAELTINGNVNNFANIQIGNTGDIVGNRLVINGDYTGANDAIIYMNTALSDQEDSKADQLIISGHAGGTSLIHINDVDGTGASTSPKGIKIIENGSSDINAFKLENTVVKGAYEYVLNRDNSDQNWYLTSYQDNLYRPDFGVYIANMDSVVKSLLPSFGAKPSGALAAGAGGLRAMDRLSQEASGRSSSVWMINTVGTNKGEAANGQIKFNYNEFSSVIGIDNSFNHADSAFVVGVMTGYTNVSSSSNNKATGSDSSGSVNGNTFGVYGTWYFEADNPLSPFIDGYFSYGHYRNSSSTQGNSSDAYSANLFSYTLQGGYPLLVSDNLVFEPQAQVSYLNYNTGDFTDHAGTEISQSLEGHYIYRVGGYVYPFKGEIKPFAGINVWYDGTQSSVNYDNTRLDSDKAGVMTEFKVGIQSQFQSSFSLATEINYRVGQHGSESYNMNLGLKYQF